MPTTNTKEGTHPAGKEEATASASSGSIVDSERHKTNDDEPSSEADNATTLGATKEGREDSITTTKTTTTTAEGSPVAPNSEANGDSPSSTLMTTNVAATPHHDSSSSFSPSKSASTTLKTESTMNSSKFQTVPTNKAPAATTGSPSSFSGASFAMQPQPTGQSPSSLAARAAASAGVPIRLHLKPSSSSSLGRKKSRKRKVAGNPLADQRNNNSSGYNSSGSSGGSSGGSSDEEDVDTAAAAAGGAYHPCTNPHGSRHHHHLHSSSSPQQLQHHHHKIKAARTAANTGDVMSNANNSKNNNAKDPMNIAQHHPRTGAAANNNHNNTLANKNKASVGGAEQQQKAATDHNSGNHHNNRQQSDQPKGWRVKLYRLNADGSWDDCGTGRIQCLYKQPQPQSLPDSNHGSDASSHHHHHHHSTHQNPTDQWLYQKTGEPTLVVQAEMSKQNRQPRVLLRTRILLRDAYQRQGDNIITWSEPCYTPPAIPQHQLSPKQQQARSSNGGEGGVDLALSFQDNAGCLDIWRQITNVQSLAAEWSAPSQVQRLAAAVAAQHHADLVQQDQQQQQQQASSSPQGGGGGESPQSQQAHRGGVGAAAAVGGHHGEHGQGSMGPNHHHHHGGGKANNDNNAFRNLQQPSQQASTEQLWAHMTEEEHHRSFGGPNGYPMLEAAAPLTLPDPPTLQNLEEVADSIAALQHVQQRESLAMWIAKDECRYLKALLTLFVPAEHDADYEKLATLAACVKTILLLNDPSIVELIVTIADLFEKVCACLEYDPDLREKANHRWFLRERAKFRTVVPMEDPDLVAAIHRSFRVNYLRDTLLRPTMDESSLSALSSMQTFSHGDIVKSVTLSPEEDASLADSYLMRLIRVFGNELHALSVLDWMELDAHHADSQIIPDYDDHEDDSRPDPSIIVMGKSSSTIMDGATWKQYLAPQDASMRSRRIRRRGCLSFLRELFSMVRNSLQQSDKDDFFAVICGFEVELGEDISDNVSQNSQIVEVGSVASTVKSDRLGTDASSQAELPLPSSPVTLLSLLGNVLCDPNTDATEKGSVMEIIGIVAMHDPALIRRHCLAHYNEKKKATAEREAFVGRPDPNEHKQVVFQCPHNDLLAALLFLLDAETDAGVLLQVSEIMRLLLDTDMMGDQGPPNAGFADEAEGIAPHAAHGADHPNPPSASGNVSSSANATTDQKQFLTMFYESYVEWLVAPFQFQIYQCVRRVPAHVLRSPQEHSLMEKMMATFRKGIPKDDQFLRPVPACAMRSSFAVELLSFCVRAHLYRMKFFLLKSRVLGNVLDILNTPADRCLKLASLRFLRAVLSVNDEFYHRHIIQQDLFAPVFAAFRANPVGDNLVSSAIVEMCDYIHAENIRSLLEYVVTKHLSAAPPHEAIPSLEDVSSPYVSTLTVLRKAYETQLQKQQHHLQKQQQQQQQQLENEEQSQQERANAGSRYFPAHAPELTGEALEDQRKFQQADAEASYFESNKGGNSDDLLHRTPRMFSFSAAAATDINESSDAGGSVEIPK